MGASTTTVRRAHSHPRTIHSPRTMEEYARAFDRALAAKYVQDLRTRMKQAQVGGKSYGSLPDLSKAAAAMQNPSALALRQRRIPTQNTNNTQTYLMPRLDICDCCPDDATSSRVTATFELPGMSKTDIALEVRSGWLIVQGTRRPPAQLRHRTTRVLTQSLGHASPSVPTARVESHLRSTSPKADGVDNVPSQVPEYDRESSCDPARSGRDNSATQPSQDDHDMDVEIDYTAHAHAHAISEIRYGKFKRAVRLPPGTDASDIDATMSDGMLVVSWPRSQQGQQTPKQIRVA